MDDFVDPDVERLALKGGKFVEIKRRLNAGENQHMFARMVKRMVVGEAVELDPDKVGLAKLQEYIVGWSLTDKAGRPVPISAAAIANLSPERFREITEVIDAHVARVEAEADEEKKDLVTESASSPTSPSAGG